jgi:cytochrome oxidase assembly protein ShyY1
VTRAHFLAVVRWVLTAVGVGLLVLLMWHLSRWQWHKHLARDTEISRQQDNLRAPVVGLNSLVTTPAVQIAQEWRRVRLTGTYDRSHQLVVTLRTVNGVGGSEVLTPLRLGDGREVLVDRGFYAVPDSAPAGSPGIAPTAPAGRVELMGYLRLPEGTSRAAALNEGQTTLTQIDPVTADTVLPYKVLSGYVTLVSGTPAQADGLTAITPPTYDTGPYLSYSVQWIIFCVIAVGGLIMLGVDEFGGGNLRTRLRAADAASAAAHSGARRPAPAAPVVGVPAPTGAAAPLPAVKVGERTRTTVLAGGAGPHATLDARFFEADDDEPDGSERSG